MDPFDANRIALRCTDSIIFVNDFRPGPNSTPPSGQGKKLYLYGQSAINSSGFGSENQNCSPRSGSFSISPPGGDNYPDGVVGDKRKVTGARIKNMVKELVTGEIQQIPGGESLHGRVDTLTHLSDCVQVGTYRLQ